MGWTVALENIKKEYLSGEQAYPWVVMYSGGKDSTALVILVWLALWQLSNEGHELRRRVCVVYSNTGIENPILHRHAVDELQWMQRAARRQALPVEVHVVRPALADSFYVLTVGRGYPLPHFRMRYCTARLKTQPTSRFVRGCVAEHGGCVVLLGVRKDESAQRARSLQRHGGGGRLARYKQCAGAYVFSPLTDCTLVDVWTIVEGFVSPWDGNNKRLIQLYQASSPNAKRGARLGCYMCTLIRRDKSMEHMVTMEEYAWLRPLLDLRNLWYQRRNASEYRSGVNAQGASALHKRTGRPCGIYTLAYRQQMLKELLHTQSLLQRVEPTMELITPEEVALIEACWEGNRFVNETRGDV